MFVFGCYCSFLSAFVRCCRLLTVVIGFCPPLSTFVRFALSFYLCFLAIFGAYCFVRPLQRVESVHKIVGRHGFVEKRVNQAFFLGSFHFVGNVPVGYVVAKERDFQIGIFALCRLHRFGAALIRAVPRPCNVHHKKIGIGRLARKQNLRLVLRRRARHAKTRLFQSKRHRFENESVSYRQHRPFHPNLLLSIRKIHTRGYKTFLYEYIITQPIYAPQYPFGYFKATFLEIFEYFWNKKTSRNFARLSAWCFKR